jgi:hypothetical protein
MIEAFHGVLTSDHASPASPHQPFPPIRKPTKITPMKIDVIDQPQKIQGCSCLKKQKNKPAREGENRNL